MVFDSIVFNNDDKVIVVMRRGYASERPFIAWGIITNVEKNHDEENYYHVETEQGHVLTVSIEELYEDAKYKKATRRYKTYLDRYRVWIESEMRWLRDQQS